MRLIRKYMAAKPLPYRAEDWPDVVTQAFGIMSDHDWVPAATLVTGLPGDTPDDINDAIELVETLGKYRSLIVPLFFVPMKTPKLIEKRRSAEKLLSEKRVELFYRCLRHSAKWIPSLLEYRIQGLSWLPKLIIWFTVWHACEASKKIDLEELVKAYSEKKNPSIHRITREGSRAGWYKNKAL